MLAAEMAEVEAEVAPITCGALIFNQDRSSVVLVKTSSGWNFPSGTSDETPEPVAAVSIVKDQTGMDVEEFLLPDHIEAELDAETGTQIHLHIAVGVPEEDLNPATESGVELAEWKPVNEILADDASEEESNDKAYMHLIPQIVDVLQRQPDVLYPEADKELASVVVFDSAKWVGPTPKQHLIDYCERNQLPSPCFNFFYRSKQQQQVSRKQLISATCILSHLGVQVTPERGAMFPRDAEETAALHALMYLEGAIPPSFPFCRITPVGFLPTLNPRAVHPITSPEEEAAKREARYELEKERLMREIEQRQKQLEEELAEVQRQKQALEEGGDVAADLIARVKRLQAWDGPGPTGHTHEAMQWMGPHSSRARPTKRARTAIPNALAAQAAANAALPGPQLVAGPAKNPIQEVKEFCDKRKDWKQPEYAFTKDETTNKFYCTVSLPCASISGITSTAEATQKSAKGIAAALLIKQLAALPPQPEA